MQVDSCKFSQGVTLCPSPVLCGQQNNLKWESNMIERRQFYINGTWVNPIDGQDHHVINPTTEESCAVISLGGTADTNAAVAAAKAAWPAWSSRPASERIELVEKLLAAYQDRAEDMAQAISMEMGAPIDMSRQQQIGVGPFHIDGFLRAAKNFKFERPLGDHAPTDMILWESVGVCALITPWNWPMNQIILKVAAAAIAGCTMVLKPSEESPISGMIFAEIMDAAGFPAGVFNLINGDGMGVGTDLSGHPDVDMVSFTGSTRAGIAISKNAADTLKRVHLELGGKGANLIFADADEKAVSRGVLRVMNNSGQSCNAPTRMLVERAIYDQAVETARTIAEKTEVGPADIEGRQIGPVVTEAQFNKIQFLIKRGIDEGAKLIAGGLGRPERLNQGYFVRPTIFANVTQDMTIWKEEIFGPVLCITPFDSEEKAITLANDTCYGLTNYVQTSNKVRARRVARQLRSGMVEMNGKFGGAGSPFGGMKQSGNGREGGTWGLEEFLEVKAVSDWE